MWPSSGNSSLSASSSSGLFPNKASNLFLAVDAESGEACPRRLSTRYSPRLDAGIRDRLCAAILQLRVGLFLGVSAALTGDGRFSSAAGLGLLTFTANDLNLRCADAVSFGGDGVVRSGLLTGGVIAPCSPSGTVPSHGGDWWAVERSASTAKA